MERFDEATAGELIELGAVSEETKGGINGGLDLQVRQENGLSDD